MAQQIGSDLLPAFWPVIHPGDPQWVALATNYRYEHMKNQPYRYHNGGLWPVLTGLYTLGLIHQGERKRAQCLLHAITQVNAQGEDGSLWDFAEYHHGQTHQPMGTRRLAWSGAASVLAYQAVWQGISSWPL